MIEVSKKRFDGESAVVAGEAIGGGKLCHGLIELGNEEQWVVAEASSAAWLGEDAAFDGTLGSEKDLAVASEGEDAAITGVSTGFWTAIESSQKSGVVTLIGRRGHGVGEGEIVCEASAADAGGVVEGGDFEAGVVGENEQAR